MPEINELAEALAAFQAEVSDPEKTKTATVQPKDRSKPAYAYGYADLATVLESVRPVLARHGLAVVQNLESDDGAVSVWTFILHKSGQRLDLGPFRLPSGGEPKMWGSAATYGRRFALMAALGIAAAGDDDARAASRGATRGRPQHATSRQLAKIAAEAERAHVTDETLSEVLTKRYSVETTSELTVEAASDLIDRLISQADQRLAALQAGADPETGELPPDGEDEDEPPGHATMPPREAAPPADDGTLL